MCLFQRLRDNLAVEVITDENGVDWVEGWKVMKKNWRGYVTPFLERPVDVSKPQVPEEPLPSKLKKRGHVVYKSYFDSDYTIAEYKSSEYYTLFEEGCVHFYLEPPTRLVSFEQLFKVRTKLSNLLAIGSRVSMFETLHDACTLELEYVEEVPWL